MSAEPFPESISVVLPVLDEEECIEKQVVDCADFLPTAFASWEVVVVDDGSRDGTAGILSRLQERIPELVVVTHPKNRGYGRAIDSGFRRAKGELVFFTDADNQFDIRELRAVTQHLHDTGASAVFGFRVYRYDSVLRCLLSWTYNRLVRVLFRVKVRDVDCSFKLFRREVIDALVIECNDFFVDTEIVARTAHGGFDTVETGVRHYPRTAGRTTVRASHIPRTLMTVARMWWRIHFKKPAPDHLIGHSRETTPVVDR